MTTPVPLTHKDLVVRAERWLRNSVGCSVVLTELVTAAGEVPDAIGWKSSRSTLVECKTSRSDFARDKAKEHRQLGMNMGSQCYYLVPPGLITKEECPSYWGLLECHPRMIKVVKKASTRAFGGEDDWRATYTRQMREIMMLVSALRRANETRRVGEPARKK